ncbi:zf-HC2 domain-containing protein [Ornithinimicrobium sediminis]|uniref:zf-HC2 domain-containing protein n=1 Tax=Ornithinimicrobium sediminis TaxID=2904603 RepID=UPI001E350585|nr:zf-HC2 domain-containing protein [Ornithinimicrobium sediminis]MCE0486546.1 zf-HC2 domain-containing protein [Ornithinimicrobium sediminis]
MKQSLRQMITCHWSARRIQRYLDADPSAPLAPGEVARLEAHLAICDTCAKVAEEHRILHKALSRWSGAVVDDDAAVQRLQSFVDSLVEDEQR